QNRSMDLLHVIRVMKLNTLREVSESEIRTAAERWAGEEDFRRKMKGDKSSAARFSLAARGWFRFQGLLMQPSAPICHFDSILDRFNCAMQSRCAPETLRTYVPRIRTFLRWAATRHDNLLQLSLQDIEGHLESKRSNKWRPATLKAYCQ